MPQQLFVLYIHSYVRSYVINVASYMANVLYIVHLFIISYLLKILHEAV